MGLEWKKSLALIIIIPNFSYAAVWEVLPTNVNGAQSMVDVSSIQTDENGNKLVWVQQVFDKYENDKQLNISYNLVKNMFSVNCNKRLIGWQSGVYYLNEKVMLNESLPSSENVNFEPIPPDSLGDDIYNKLCK